MHPFGLYVAAVDAERNSGGNAQRNRQPQYATVDALPLTEPACVSRLSRLMTVLRRGVTRLASA